MLRFALLEAARLASSLIGAALMATAVASLSIPGAWHGFDPFLSRMAARLASVLSLDFGVSAVSGRSALLELIDRLPETLTLAAAGAVLAVAIGGPLGIVFGAGPVRRASAPLIQIVAAAPVFCAALALAWVAQRVFHWPVDVGGVGTKGPPLDFSSPAAAFKVLALPALTVGAAGAASIQLAIRSASAQVAREPWRDSLRRMGLSALEVERVYVAPQVAAGVFANVGELTLVLLSASAVAEWVFNRPGAAVLFVKSVALADWSMVALVLFAFAALKLAADFAGNVLARALSSPELGQ
jgi:peptide/nickel transport system permease protein